MCFQVLEHCQKWDGKLKRMDWIIKLSQVPQGKIVIKVSILIWKMIWSLDLLEWLLAQLHLQFQCISSQISNINHISTSGYASITYILYLLSRIYNAERWLCTFQILLPWQNPVPVSYCHTKAQIYHGKLYWACCTARTQWSSVHLIPGHLNSREKELLPDCTLSRRRCFTALPQKASILLHRVQCSVTPLLPAGSCQAAAQKEDGFNSFPI